MDQSALLLTPKLVSAAVLICCAHRVSMFKAVSDDANVALLRMMALSPDGEGFEFLGSFMTDEDSRWVNVDFCLSLKTSTSCIFCPSLDLLAFIIFCCFRVLVMESLTDVMNHVIRRRQASHTIHVLKALPLLHLLRGDCTVHKQCAVHPSAIVWTDPDVDLQTTNHLMYFNRGSVCLFL